MDIKFWKDRDRKIIEPELFSANAEKLAQTIAGEGNNKLNKPSQIRKFYDEVIKFDTTIKSKPEDFDKLLPYLKMLNAKAAYAKGRELISDGFKNFISKSLSQITEKDDFDVFASLFEAFMGYYKLYRPSEGGNR